MISATLDVLDAEYLEVVEVVFLPHGRTIGVGQVWRDNNPRVLRAGRVMSINPDDNTITLRDIVTRIPFRVPVAHFTIVIRTGMWVGHWSWGWSLDKEATC